jgi:hypothetical protein
MLCNGRSNSPIRRIWKKWRKDGRWTRVCWWKATRIRRRVISRGIVGLGGMNYDQSFLVNIV